MKRDEKILVVPRDVLFSSGHFQGFLPIADFTAYEALIAQHQRFEWRSSMETDPSFKQIIPYLVFTHDDTFFLMQRRSDASETRLRNNYTLGIGGHIREEDIEHKSIIQWAQREFDEEVDYTGGLSITPLGLINDDSNAVGQVHMGFVYLLEGDNASITIKSELKDGTLMTLDQMERHKDAMETWSQFVFDYLKDMSEPPYKTHGPDSISAI